MRRLVAKRMYAQYSASHGRSRIGWKKRPPQEASKFETRRTKFIVIGSAKYSPEF